MKMRTAYLVSAMGWLVLLSMLVPKVMGQGDTAFEFRAMTWNIWHGGREDGEKVGPQRVAEVIRDSRADIIAMQETYGSGEIISKALGFHFHPRGTNLSIHSRFPVIEDISVFEEFKCVGALVELPTKDRIAFYSIWLPYKEDIWLPHSREKYSDKDLTDKCNVSRDDLQKIQAAIKERLSDEKYDDVSVVIAGDFNSMSNRDYTEVNRDQFGHVVDWPTSRVLVDAGFRDSYREANPNVDRNIDSTWSPKFVEQEQDRIDFIYYRSANFGATESRVIRNHTQWFPSDHAAVVTTFRKQERPDRGRFPLRVATYNIRHGVGTDNKQFLMRSARAIKRMNVDLVGLQEIDNRCRRSGNVNQPAELGKQLGMHADFGAFMKFQGGKYGLATLSKHPIIGSEVVKLPAGREPRVALVSRIRLPNDEVFLCVNIHFDWLESDNRRFEQAAALRRYLLKQDLPWLLLGDFNDQPPSRTLKLFREIGVELEKSRRQRFTHPSEKPETEIDYLFVDSRKHWKVRSTEVVPEKTTSDHLPVIAQLQFLAPQPPASRRSER